MSVDQFADRFNRLDELDEPFRSALRADSVEGEHINIALYSPAFESAGHRRPATVLIVTDTRWLIASNENANGVQIASATFDNSLLVNLAAILLAGHLSIDFNLPDGRCGSAGVEFNTVMLDHYREAVDLILANIGGPPSAVSNEIRISQQFSAWPMKFHNAVFNFLPKRTAIREAAYWPAVIGGFQRELAPAACLVATSRELVLISDERAHRWMPAGHQAKYGTIVTYFPLVRLAGFQLNRQSKFTYLDLEAHAIHGGEVFHVAFPTEDALEIQRVMEAAMHALAAS
jgi:hypothetical protein